MTTKLDWTTDTNEHADIAPVLSSGLYAIYRNDDGSYQAIVDGEQLRIGTLAECKAACGQHAAMELAK